jgi:hypothetical protein
MTAADAIVVVAGDQRRCESFVGEDVERLAQDLGCVAAAAMLAENAEADVAALAFPVLVELVTYRHPSNDLPIDLRHEEGRANPFGMWVAPGGLLVEQIEVVIEGCGAVSVQQEGEALTSQSLVCSLHLGLILGSRWTEDQHGAPAFRPEAQRYSPARSPAAIWSRSAWS